MQVFWDVITAQIPEWFTSVAAVLVALISISMLFVAFSLAKASLNGPEETQTDIDAEFRKHTAKEWGLSVDDPFLDRPSGRNLFWYREDWYIDRDERKSEAEEAKRNLRSRFESWKEARRGNYEI